MDTIGLYIHIHLTKTRGEREEEGYLKCLIYKYCIKKKIASITLLSKYQLSSRSSRFVFIIRLGGQFRLSIQSVIKMNWNCSWLVVGKASVWIVSSVTERKDDHSHFDENPFAVSSELKVKGPRSRSLYAFVFFYLWHFTLKLMLSNNIC